jgi:uncharacterized protein YigE (DUF2233 family)
MKRNKAFVLTAGLILLAAAIFVFARKDKTNGNRFVNYTVDAKKQDVRFYWRDDKNEHFRSIQNLKLWVEKNKRKLVFAMNGGMYKPDNSPQGLYIEDNKVLYPFDSSGDDGNFYLKPNGVFYITTEDIPAICKTENFYDNGKIKYATQSGPMLVIDGQIHSAFKKESTNVNIRNGGNNVVFAMSKNEINFYDFANYFKIIGCKNVLYLDGLVSRTYLPEAHWVQSDGNFGVIIGVTTRAD